MTKYIKVTDDGATGYHSVSDDFRLPIPQPHETYEFVTEAVALKEVPGLAGETPTKK